MVQIIVTTQIALIDFFAHRGREGTMGNGYGMCRGRPDNEIKSQQLKCNTEKAVVPYIVGNKTALLEMCVCVRVCSQQFQQTIRR